MEYMHSGRGQKCVGSRRMPEAMPDDWAHVKGGSTVPRPYTVCKQCSQRLKRAVWLCEECHNNHAIWDHEMAKPASRRVTVG